MLLSLTPLEDALDPDEQEAEEVEEDLLMTMMTWMEEVEEDLLMMTTTWMEELLMKSPMVTTSRIWSPSPRPTTSKLWGHSPESLMEIGPELRPSSPNSLGTSYSTEESQDLSLLFDKLH